MSDLKMRRGDTKPYLEITCTDDGAPVDLTPATAVRVLAKPSVAGAPLIAKPALSATAEGVATMKWDAGDTDLVCTMECEVEVIWPTGDKQTFRADGRVLIYPDLG